MARATNFRQLCDLIERCEDALIAHGVTDPEQRLLMLRSVYYGASWSLDFHVERSQMRNVGFVLYTGFGIPPDPRPALGSLFNDLRRSQDVRDSGYMVDTGHALIGMETRSNLAGRHYTFPRMGGTGIEIVTWLGDMGGGAANLAWRRSASSRAASRSVRTLFRINDSDYGAPINIEGDIAGYCIGAGSSVDAPDFSSGKTIADLFREFLPISRSSRTRYARRTRDFLMMLGGTFRSSSSNRLTSKAGLISTLANKMKQFGEVYMLQRYILGQGIAHDRVQKACKQLPGCSQEVATVFVNGLLNGVSNPRRFVRGVGPWPRPTRPASSCNSLALDAASQEREATQMVEETIQEGRREAVRLLRELERERRRVSEGLDELERGARDFIEGIELP